MHKLLLAICIKLAAWNEKLSIKLKSFINTLKNYITEMETLVKSEIAGLTKTATIKSFSLDALGNIALAVAYSYKDAAGNVLKYEDDAKAGDTVSISAPDPSVDPTTYTVEQAQAASKYNVVVTALTPILATILPDAV